MKAFIIHGLWDVGFARELSTHLRDAGVETVVDSAGGMLTAASGGMHGVLAAVDLVFVVLSRASVTSEGVITTVATSHVLEKPVVGLLLEEVSVPSSLANVPVINFSQSTADGWAALDRSFGEHWKLTDAMERAVPEQRAARWRHDLTSAFDDGALTLFLGAGVSASAGMPDWAGLLGSMLEEVFTGDGRIEPGTIRAAQAVELFRDRFGASPLIVARYLKNTYRDEFIPRVRDDLYRAGAQRSSALVDAIVGLCRPRRGRQPLRSIVTFNFDDLVEQALTAQHVHHHPIHSEGQRAPADALPIYHVHGYLPSAGPVPDDHGVVLSEDAYHSQFVEAFNWSNLVQLIELTQSTCLLIGLSLNDPNLRRLLDVAARKSSDKSSPHYLIKLRPGATGLSSTRQEEAELMPLISPKVEILEEADANSLGLNVVWVDDYDEIPGVLERIGA